MVFLALYPSYTFNGLPNAPIISDVSTPFPNEFIIPILPTILSFCNGANMFSLVKLGTNLLNYSFDNLDIIIAPLSLIISILSELSKLFLFE